MGSTCAHHYPHTKFHQCSKYRTLNIWFFLLLANQNRYANEVLNMYIWWRQTTWVVLVPITTHIPSFINVANIELWIFDFFLLLANQNRYANEVLNMRIRWRQTTWVILLPPTTHIPSLTKIGHCVLVREQRFTFWCWRDLTSVHTSVHPYRQRYNWKLSGPSSIAGGPQKKDKLLKIGNCCHREGVTSAWCARATLITLAVRSKCKRKISMDINIITNYLSSMPQSRWKRWDQDSLFHFCIVFQALLWGHGGMFMAHLVL